jgi:GT2 family glycosyltransferase
VSGLPFPALERPSVSIVMPAFGHSEWVVRALGALLANTEPCYEVIVVDDASPDDFSGRLAAATENVRIVRNSRNVGACLSYNSGAAYARGEFLVFLNNDALVHAGWLPPLLETLTNSPKVGAVGPRYLNVDGSVQEAGALLFSDAATGAYGSGCPDSVAELHRPRVVDYVSGACMIVRRRVFNEIGGHDPIYTAYYSDVDLCLTLASHGYFTVYEPRSVVTHVFGWAERHAVADAEISRSRDLFAERWPDVLAARPVAEPDSIAARDAPLPDRLLVVADRPPESGSRANELILGLARLCPIAHVALLTENADPKRESDLLAAGIECARGGLESAEEWLMNRRFHYDVILSLGPRHRAFEQMIRRTQPQAVWLTDLDAAAVEGIADGRVADELAGMDAVLVGSGNAQRTVAEETTPVTVFLVGDGPGLEQSLNEVLVYFGFATTAISDR